MSRQRIAKTLELSSRTSDFDGGVWRRFLLGCLISAFGCAAQAPRVTETDPFDAAHRQLESRSHIALVEHANTVSQSSQPSPSELQTVSDQLKQVLMESRVSKTGIQPKLRRRMEAALDQIRHRVSMHPVVQKNPMNVNVPVQKGHTPFAWPLKQVRVSSRFGLRTDPFGSERRLFHDGLDLAAPQGTLVHSPAAGRVLQVGWRDNGCGLAITLMHDRALMSDYCHLSKVSVVQGQAVNSGDLIGEVGDTGRSKGPHLHWSVWKHGRAIDPESLVSGRHR